MELINYANSIRRQFDIKFDIPEQINEIPEHDQDAMPSADSVEVLSPLCAESQQFLDCLFSPPPELKAIIAAKVMSGRPHCKNILPDILRWMGLDYDKFVMVRNDIQSKCVLHI
jgi:hypothetical protein